MSNRSLEIKSKEQNDERRKNKRDIAADAAVSRQCADGTAEKVLEHTLWNCTITEKVCDGSEHENGNKADLFLASKRVEGCSEKTLAYYKATIEAALGTIDKDIRHIETEDLRQYLTEYQRKKQSSKVTIDNIRRILSSFFSWLEDEDYILKSPVRRIHRVKTSTTIKETYSDEALETMRDSCGDCAILP